MRRALVIAACLAGGAAWAQEDDRDYLTAFLEDTLSDAGRQVTVTGFEGALSSQATIESLTIADDEGIWITLNGVVLDWSRSALLSGEVEVSELSAAEIILTRIPQTDQTAAPSPEAAGFSLPELPVSINIDRVAAESIELGPEVLGEKITGTFEASLSLADGAGEAQFNLLRTGDGPQGKIALEAAYANTSRELALSLVAEEDAGGIVVRLLDIPGGPSAALTVEGQGPIDDFAAQVRLATDDEDRLAGTVTIRNEPDAGYRLLADVAGNLAPILAPEQVDFFGTDVGLKLDAVRSDTGALRVDQFEISARSVKLSGTASLAADGLPESVDVTGTLASPDGAPVLLPFGEAQTLVDRAEFRLRSEQGDRDSWSGEVTVDGLARSDVSIGLLRLKGSGRIGRTEAGNSFGGTLNLTTTGLAPKDLALAEALGSEIAASVRLHYAEDAGALRLSDIKLTGAGLAGTGALRIEGLDEAFLTSGRLSVAAEDFSRFSRLAGRALGGSGTLEISGSASRLSGFFDTELTFSGTGLRLDVAEVDRLLSGRSTVFASIRRDESGTLLRSFDVAAGGLSAKASGKVASTGSELSGTVNLADLSALGPQYSGSVALEGSFNGTPADGQLKLAGSGRSLEIGNAEADRLLAGASELAIDLALKDGKVQIRDARLSNPQLSATVSGEIAGSDRNLVVDARLANLGLIVPDVTGPLTVSGTVVQNPEAYVLDISGRGPGQVSASVEGRIASSFRSANLTIRGSGQAGLANLFVSPRSVSGLVGYDLRLAGAIALRSLSGRVTLSDGRISDPDSGLSLQEIEAIGQLSAGELGLSATSTLSSGGRLRVDGPIALAAPNRADLTIALDGVRLYDPELYETRVNGNLSLAGPIADGALLAGTLRLSETEVRVPSSGFSSAADLLNVRHVGEPSDVRNTRRKAGLFGTTGGQSGGGSSGRPIALDLTIEAPSKVFVRGRGIDAELGGEVRLSGTTNDVIPSGAFRLIRGRMDILGKRLVLSRADLVLEGSLVPQIGVSASTENDGIVSTVTVEGPADDPEVSFSSSPELPQEEVLAQLLFGRSLETISAFQAAQLANAVAVLAGRGGEGLIGKLRKNFGLDDLDVAVADDGTAALRAGKYISENVYTEIEVGQDGKSRINLNLDLREGVTVKGRLEADGETGIGVYLQRDY
ncbi:translocation/assembly module TamB domain-containing protein [Tabrizicola sp.]|uniref:translocation/assembly module TamB domain-containing protein n=1 Tax=Tabrizicola sp. TaxID=2005166 RepID=UPI003F2D976D